MKMIKKIIAIVTILVLLVAGILVYCSCAQNKNPSGEENNAEDSSFQFERNDFPDEEIENSSETYYSNGETEKSLETNYSNEEIKESSKPYYSNSEKNTGSETTQESTADEDDHAEIQPSPSPIPSQEPVEGPDSGVISLPDEELL